MNVKHVWRDREKASNTFAFTKTSLRKMSSNRKISQNNKVFAFIFLVQNQRVILILNVQCSEGKKIFLFFFSRIYIVFGSVMVQLPWKDKVHATDALFG